MGRALTRRPEVPAPEGAGRVGEVEALRSENERLRRAVQELQLLNEVATAVASARDLPAALRRIVRRAAEAVGAEQGVLALVNARPSAAAHTLVRTAVGTSEQPAYRANDLLLGWTLIHRRPVRIEEPEADERFRGAGWDPAVRSVLAAPLIAHGRVAGSLTLYNKKGSGGFSDEDERLLAILASQSAQVVEALRLAEERDRVLRLFGQHTAPAVVEELVREGADLPSRRQFVCVLFFDLREYAARAEAWAPEEAVDYLNTVFALAIEEVTRRHGQVLQLLGDGFMAVFGAPLAHGADCRHAVEAARALVRRIAAAGRVGAIPPTEVSVGLHAGEALTGIVGSTLHREYSVTGDVVNVASRLQELCREAEAQVLASEAVCAGCEAGSLDAEELGLMPLRGRREPVRVYRLA